MSKPDLKRPSGTSWWRWKVRRAHAIATFDPRYANCGCCGVGMHAAKFATTWDHGSGACPLCVSCSADMTPAERLPYYDRLFADWQRGGYWDASDYSTREDYIAHLKNIRVAVLAGDTHG